MSRMRSCALALVAALGSHQVLAEDRIIAVSSQGLAEADQVLSAAGRVFGALQPGDSLTLLDGSSGSVVQHLPIPEKGRYKLQKYVEKDFSGEIRRIRSYLTALAKSDPVPVASLVTDIPALAGAIAELRTDKARPAHVLIIGNPMRIDKETPGFSMIDSEGQLYIPSDGLLRGPLSSSPYGLGVAGRPLEGVSVHFCALMATRISIYKKTMLGRAWAHYFALRGATLASFSPDIRLCLKRYLEGHAAALDVTPLDAGADAAMLRLSMGRAVSLAEEELEVSVRRNRELEATLADTRVELTKEQSQARSLSKDLANSETRRKAAEQSPKLKVLKRTLADTKQKTDDLASALEDSERKRKEAEQALEKIKIAIDDSKSLDGVTTFSRFQEIRHKRHGKLLVTTGVRYQMADFPAYDTSWCYINARNDRGSRINVSLGTKDRGKSAVWAKPQSSVLKDVGLTKSEFTDYRQSCRFPED